MEEISFREYCEQHNEERLLRECKIDGNESFDPSRVGYASHRVVWWQCTKGHRWQASVSTRTCKGVNCPYCANKKVLPGYNDLTTLSPEKIKEWHPTKNGGLLPEHVVCGSDRIVWWQCELGHEWRAAIANRVLKKQRCPYCSGKKAWPGYNDLATLYPKLMKQWHPVLNEGIDPATLRPGSGRRVWWQCSEGHVWDATVVNRTSKARPGCPVCAGNQKMSKASEWIMRAKAREEELEKLAQAKESRVHTLMETEQMHLHAQRQAADKILYQKTMDRETETARLGE